jgi:polysaccharide chain length determinant protein (PEP-CTERM system associated)
MDTTEITKYLDIAKRRKYWIVIPFLVTILAGLTYVLNAPKVYEAETLILVETQSVPQDLVRTIVTEGVDERLRTITQEVTSRTNLEKIIRDHQLMGEESGSVSLDAMVEAIKRQIRIEVARPTRFGGAPGSFTISYRGKTPNKVMQVTNALAYNFISQNLETRESKVMGTSAFLAEELESVRKRLSEKEEELKAYRERYMGGLPDQLNANLASLQRLQMQMDQLSNNLRDAENRKVLIQQTIEEARRGRVPVLPPSAQGSEARDPATLRNELAALEARYTPNHPDVVRLKKTIESLEGTETRAGSAADSPPRATVLSAAEQALVQQLRDIQVEILGSRVEIGKVQSEINLYKRRVEDTPKREQELFSTERDYNNQRDLYNSLLQRKLEADIAVSMERKQRGERFRVLDEAKVPTNPVEPDTKRILLLVVALSFGLGGGLAYLREMLDTSYKAPEDLEKDLDMKILVSIPYRYTERELRNRKIREVFKAASVGAGFAVGAVAIVAATKGVEGTLNFFKNLMGIT